MNRCSPIVFLNQVTGPLFRELVEDVTAAVGDGTLITDCAVLPAGYQPRCCTLRCAPAYDRRSGSSRLRSWLRYFVKALWEVFKMDPADRLLIVTNPPFLGWAGWVAAVLRGQRYVMLVYDVYPGLLENLGRLRRGGVIARLWRWSNRVSWGRADRIVTIGSYMADNVRGMLRSADRAKVTVIPIWADGSIVFPRPKRENWFALRHGLADALCVLYSGNVGATHDLEALLAAAEHTRGDARIKFVLIGGGERWPAVQETVIRRQLGNVLTLPWQPEEHLPFTLTSADVAVVTLQQGVEGHSFPSKTAFALAAGSALLVLAHGRNELTDLVEEHGCGLAVAADDADAVVAALHRFSEDTGFLARCRAAARQTHERLFSRANTAAYVALLQ